MKISGVNKGRTEKVVMFEDVSRDTPDIDLLQAALKAAGETRSSIFSHYITHYREYHEASIRLCTD